VVFTRAAYVMAILVCLFYEHDISFLVPLVLKPAPLVSRAASAYVPCPSPLDTFALFLRILIWNYFCSGARTQRVPFFFLLFLLWSLETSLGDSSTLCVLTPPPSLGPLALGVMWAHTISCLAWFCLRSPVSYDCASCPTSLHCAF